MRDTSTDLSSGYRFGQGPATSDPDPSLLSKGGQELEDYSSRVHEFSVVEHELPSGSFHGRSPGQLPSRKLTQGFIVGNIADGAGVALLVFVEQICSPLPFLASKVLVRSVD